MPPQSEPRVQSTMNPQATLRSSRQDGRRSAWTALVAILLHSTILDPVLAVGARQASDFQHRLGHLTRVGAPGALALVRVDGRTWMGSAGMADRGTGRKAKTEDVWRIASVTKMVTAVIVLQLSRERRLDLDDAVGKYLADLRREAGAVTIRQLLDHSSGLAEYLSDDAFGGSAATLLKMIKSPSSTQAMVAIALAQEWLPDPLAEHQYANTNYVLLERVIEAVTGQSYKNVVNTQLIDRLRLLRTGFPDAQGRLPRAHLKAYIPRDSIRGPFTDTQRLVDVTTHPYFLGGDGGLYSTLFDMSLIFDAIWSGRLGDARLFETMIGRLKSDHDGLYRYGFGVMAVSLSCGVTIYGHEGLDFGSTTIAFSDRTNRRQMILVVNARRETNKKLDSEVLAFQSRVFCGSGRSAPMK
ncbi:MAG: serine hydrolase domain-containing protein [Hyphomicrobiaceae bacterium]